MIEDFKKHNGDKAEFNADLCIIGAGAAGITLARQFLNTKISVILLESGGHDYDKNAQSLAEGNISDSSSPYYDLGEARLRFFGGTTAIWGGRVAQLDAIDFKKRDWVAHSGWPFGKEELSEHYKKAQDVLQLPHIENNSLPSFKSDIDDNIISSAFWQFDEVFDRFTLPKCNDLKSASNIKIMLNATAIKLCDAGSCIDNVEIANLFGGKGSIKAKHYVLATGGLEVPRILLSSTSENSPNGIGNNYDQVGRYFMEHPHARSARINVDDPKKLFKHLPRFMRFGGYRYGMLFRPGDELQKKKGILNTGFTMAVRKHPDGKQAIYKDIYNTMRHELNPTRSGRGVWRISRKISSAVQDHFGAALNVAKLKKKDYGLYTVMRAEQAPNPDSRLVLSDKKDALGMSQINLNWKFSNIDKHSVSASMEAFGSELERVGLGSVETQPWLSDDNIDWEVDPLVSNHAIGGYHHMGTTRMSDDIKKGVVDKDCRIHGCNNLYVAGSSVFPTGGWANPTQPSPSWLYPCV